MCNAGYEHRSIRTKNQLQEGDHVTRNLPSITTQPSKTQTCKKETPKKKIIQEKNFNRHAKNIQDQYLPVQL